MKFLAGVALSALTSIAGVAAAQSSPATGPVPATAPQAPAAASATPTVGATVYDSAGAVLGTVTQVTPQAVTVDVGGKPAPLPANAIGSGPRGLQVAVTRAQVEAQLAQAVGSALEQQLVAGAQVRGTGGAVVGTVKSADAELVTVTTAKGDVRLPRSGFAAGTNGVVVGLTAAQLDAAIAQAGGGASTSGAGTAAATGDSTGETTEPTAAATPSAAASTTKSTTKRTTRTIKRTTDR
jgi:hypothetical protein